MRCGTKRRGTPGLPISWWVLCCMPFNKFRRDLGRHVRSFGLVPRFLCSCLLTVVDGITIPVVLLWPFLLSHLLLDQRLAP